MDFKINSAVFNGCICLEGENLKLFNELKEVALPYYPANPHVEEILLSRIVERCINVYLRQAIRYDIYVYKESIPSLLLPLKLEFPDYPPSRLLAMYFEKKNAKRKGEQNHEIN